jgi:hypothetical protein
MSDAAAIITFLFSSVFFFCSRYVAVAASVEVDFYPFISLPRLLVDGHLADRHLAD